MAVWNGGAQSLQGFLVATFIWTLNGSPITTLMILYVLLHVLLL